MNHDEKIAQDYLYTRGYSKDEVVYEPDGNTPPDFLVDGEIAVEVRRLNASTETNGQKKGVEVDSRPMCQSVSSTLKEFNGRIPGKIFPVFLTYGNRPLPKAKKAKQLTREVLHDVCENPRFEGEKRYVKGNLTFIIIPISAPVQEDKTFLMAGYIDHACTGSCLPMMQDNIQHYSDEKIQKIQTYRHKYKTWWLVLVDNIGHGLDDFGRELFYDKVKIIHQWDKIIIIPPSLNKNKTAIEILNNTFGKF